MFRWLASWCRNALYLDHYLTEVPALRRNDDLLRQQADERDALIKRQAEEISELHDKLALLLDPPLSHRCTKLRHCNREEAQAVADRMGQGHRQVPAAPYACKKCPRHPSTLKKYWHVRGFGSDPEEKAERARRRSQNVSYQQDGVPAKPTQIAELRKKFNGNSTT